MKSETFGVVEPRIKLASAKQIATNILSELSFRSEVICESQAPLMTEGNLFFVESVLQKVMDIKDAEFKERLGLIRYMFGEIEQICTKAEGCLDEI